MPNFLLIEKIVWKIKLKNYFQLKSEPEVKRYEQILMKTKLKAAAL